MTENETKREHNRAGCDVECCEDSNVDYGQITGNIKRTPPGKKISSDSAHSHYR